MINSSHTQDLIGCPTWKDVRNPGWPRLLLWRDGTRQPGEFDPLTSAWCRGCRPHMQSSRLCSVNMNILADHYWSASKWRDSQLSNEIGHTIALNPIPRELNEVDVLNVATRVECHDQFAIDIAVGAILSARGALVDSALCDASIEMWHDTPWCRLLRKVNARGQRYRNQRRVDSGRDVTGLG